MKPEIEAIVLNWQNGICELEFVSQDEVHIYITPTCGMTKPERKGVGRILEINSKNPGLEIKALGINLVERIIQAIRDYQNAG